MANYGKFINSILNPLIEYGYQYEVSKRQFGTWYISFGGIAVAHPMEIIVHTTQRRFFFNAVKYPMTPAGFSWFRKAVQDMWTKAYK